MPLRILVSGLLPHDSGKTWLGAALLDNALKRGLNASGYKPVGGFSAWYSYDALSRSMQDRILAGGDARTYAEITLDPIVDVNPVAYATAVPDPAAQKPASYMARLSSILDTTALWRLTDCTSGTYTHYYSPRVLRETPPPLRQVLEEAVGRLDAEPGKPPSFFETLASSQATEMLEKCRERVERGKSLVIIESFNDAVLPYDGLDPCIVDFYVVAAPGAALLYTGERLCKALAVLGSVKRVERLLNVLSKPLAVAYLPPVRSWRELAASLGDEGLLGLLLG